MLKLFQKAGWRILRVKGRHVMAGPNGDRPTTAKPDGMSAIRARQEAQ
ncbi:MAG TPA: type II toxin-antitoxin system HicA family toxin [Spirochaetota bacterium]|nr:type II toxin-antitoxin system HicA family toxin [Spirochaetota bacterium]